MTHEQTKREFARQAAAMSAAAVFNAQEVLAAIVQAGGQGPGRSALDVGCGPGIVVEALAKAGGAVTGIDLTPEMIEQARSRCGAAGLSNVKLLVGPAEQLPFETGRFDAAVSRVTIHHLADPAKVVAEMARVVKPGGRLALADIVSSEDPEESRLHNALEVLRDPSHATMLPLSALLEMVAAAGLRLVAQQCWNQQREFGEWMRIANAPQRVEPLRAVMSALAGAGKTAGIDLQCRDGKLTFTHKLVMLVAEE